MRGRVENVRRHLARLRATMASPAVREIEEALPGFAEAITAMQEMERKLADGATAERGLAAALAALMREIGSTQEMADRGWELYRLRARELATLAAGYGATGMPAPLPPAATIRIEG